MRFDESAGFSLDRRQCLLGLGALTGMALLQGRAAFGSTIDLQVATALDLSAGLKAGTWSARELAQHCFGRIEALNGPFERFDDNGALNAFIRTFPDLARLGWERADRADRARPDSDWSGVPVALKDVYSVAGKPVTVGTPAHRSYRAPKDCTLWRKWSDAGAVLLGHTQAQHFITGLETPQTANPWNPRLIVGGSSGGSAAAVAAGLVPIALGGETAGSLIYPALCCAVTTLKPSLGLLSLAGSFPGWQSLDVGGPLARSAADCAWALATLVGVDPEDPMTAEQQGQSFVWPDLDRATQRGDRPLQGLRLLVAPNERYLDSTKKSGSDAPEELSDADPLIRKGFGDLLASLTALGAEIVPAEIPEELGLRGLFNRKEARFGGYSARTLLATADDLTVALPGQQQWLAQATPEEWEIAIKLYESKDRSLKSEELLSKAALVNPQTLALARAEREELRRGWEALFARYRCDAHVYLEVGSSLPERKGLEDTPSPRLCRNGVRPNDLGWPVLGLPVSRVEGLDVPISAQIMARRWHDPRLLAWGMAWQQRHPEFVRLVPKGLTAAA
jgi:Asp-tRNA(Asn)/Glu-tRNA(Gln) amidotransferase A subunit family amidase